MFNKKKIEALERRIEYLEDRERDLKAELIGKRILRRAELYGMGVNLPSVPAISLEDLQTMQERILDYLNAELKTMEAKTELVAKDKHIFPVCAPEEDLKAEKVELDKLENCFVCPKCNKHPIGIMWDNEKDCLEKHCECGYSWREDCLDKKSK